MNYESALKLWGKLKVEQYWQREADLDFIRVELEFEEGSNCCGGYDENCYCSMAESPSANVVIYSNIGSVSISHYEFDFATVLKEICEAADGTITS